MPANYYKFKESWFIPHASVEQVWAILSDPVLAPHWWKGVYLAVEPEASKCSYRCVARGFLPYKLRFDATIEQLIPNEKIVVKTTGDFQGIWQATVRACDSRGCKNLRQRGCQIDTDWEVTVVRPIVKHLSLILKPVFALNHYYTTILGEKGLTNYLQAL